MKQLILPLLIIAIVGSAHASDPVPQTGASLPWNADSENHAFTQTFSLQAGPFRPKTVNIANSNYDFSYGNDALNSYQILAGWGARLFSYRGSAFSLQENFAFSPFTLNVAPGQTLAPNTHDVHLYMFGLDSRVRYSAEWFPWHRLIPFVEGGYRFTIYNQSGPYSDFESASGGVGNAVAAGGLNILVSPKEAAAIPVFITGSAQWLSGRPDMAVDLGGLSFVGGVSIGL